VEGGLLAVMDPGQVLEAQAERTLTEIGQLEKALDDGELVTLGSMGQPVGNKLLGELRQHRLLLLRLLGVSAFGEAPASGPDELDQLRREWETSGGS
jgi:hypothetical protein